MWGAHQKLSLVAEASSVNLCLFGKAECVGTLQGFVCVAGSVSALGLLLLSLLSTLRTTNLRAIPGPFTVTLRQMYTRPCQTLTQRIRCLQYETQETEKSEQLNHLKVSGSRSVSRCIVTSMHLTNCDTNCKKYLLPDSLLFLLALFDICL